MGRDWRCRIWSTEAGRPGDRETGWPLSDSVLSKTASRDVWLAARPRPGASSFSRTSAVSFYSLRDEGS